MKFAKFSILMTAIAYLIIGMMILTTQTYWASGIDVVIPTATAIIDLQVTYGGCMLALGIFFLYCFKNSELFRVGLILQAISLGAFAFGRILGIAIYGIPKPIMFYLLAAEISGVILAVYCLSQLKD